MDVVSALGGLLVTISALVIFIMAWIEKLSDEEVRSSDDVSSTDWPLNNNEQVTVALSRSKAEYREDQRRRAIARA